jgi:hypothetical protein
VDRISREKQPSLPEDWPQRIRQELIPLRQLRGPGEPQMGNLEARFAFADRILALRSVYVDRGFAGASSDELILDCDCYVEQRGSPEVLDVPCRSFEGSPMMPSAGPWGTSSTTSSGPRREDRNEGGFGSHAIG